MNATNRILNRALLLLVGLVLVAAGLAGVAVAVRPPWATGVIDGAGRWLANVPAAPPVIWATAGLAAAVLAVLLIAFVFTRGRGRTATVLRAKTAVGVTTVDRDVADAVLAGPLRSRPDVISAHTAVYCVKGAPAIRFAVTVRQGADLSRVLAAAGRSTADWDALAGRPIPILLHLTDRGWRDGLRSAVRVR